MAKLPRLRWNILPNPLLRLLAALLLLGLCVSCSQNSHRASINSRIRIIGVDGKSAAGASIFVLDPELAPDGLAVSLPELVKYDPRIEYREVQAPFNPSAEIFAGRANQHGMISLDAVPNRSVLIVFDNTGYALERRSDIFDSLHLKSWPSITGRAMRGPQPDSGTMISCKSKWVFSDKYPPLTADQATTTDREGKFQFHQIFAGATYIAKQHAVKEGYRIFVDWTDATELKTEDGKISQVQLGGKGARIVAKFQADPLKHWDFAAVRLVDASPHDSLNPSHYFAELSDTSTVSAFDLPSGTYWLQVELYEMPSPTSLPQPIGSIQHSFSVQKLDEQQGTLIDLGKLIITKANNGDIKESIPNGSVYIIPLSRDGGK